MALDDRAIERFSRQLILPEVGVAGQQRLLSSRVLLVALEPAIATAAIYLAAAGTGTLGLADTATVQSTDLDAPLAFSRTDFGHPRPWAVAGTMGRVNPETKTIVVPDLAAALSDGAWDAVLCHAGGGTAVICNRFSLAARVPLIVARADLGYGWLVGFAGNAPHGPCWECIPLERRGEAAVCSPAAHHPPAASSFAAGAVGTLVATETIKLLVGIGQPLSGRRISYESSVPAFRVTRVAADPRCVACARSTSCEETRTP